MDDPSASYARTDESNNEVNMRVIATYVIHPSQAADVESTFLPKWWVIEDIDDTQSRVDCLCQEVVDYIEQLIK